MATIIITKEKEFNWDIAVFEVDNPLPLKKTWAANKDQAIGKAEILAEYFTDDNGQRATIVIN